MTTAPQNPTARNADFERLFTGDRQINVTHFYSIGQKKDGREQFAVGYWTHDDVFLTGITTWDAAACAFGVVH